MRVVLVVAALLLYAPAWAQTAAPAATPAAAAAPAPRSPRSLQARFDAANTTHDGHLTLDQAKAGHMFAVARDFAAIDTAHHGYVTVDDIKAHQKAVRQAKKAAKTN